MRRLKPHRQAHPDVAKERIILVMSTLLAFALDMLEGKMASMKVMLCLMITACIIGFRHGADAGMDVRIIPSDYLSKNVGEPFYDRWGVYPYAGLVEVLINGDWGTICAWDWDLQDAAVVCKQLGLGYPETAVRNIRDDPYGFAPGNGSMCLSQVLCYGHENNIGACGGISIRPANHTNDMGIVCFPPIGEGIRLTGGNNEYEGVMEIEVSDGNWSRAQIIGDDSAYFLYRGYNEPRFCHQLGYGQSITKLRFDNISISQVTSLWDCAYGILYLQACDAYHRLPSIYDNDFGIMCHTQDPSIRLAGGSDSFEGRVEVFIHGVWGSIDSQWGWGRTEGDVACRQLGMGQAVQAYTKLTEYNYYAAVMRNVTCTGRELFLHDCERDVTYNVKQYNFHSPYLAARVRCQPEAMRVCDAPVAPPGTSVWNLGASIQNLLFTYNYGDTVDVICDVGSNQFIWRCEDNGLWSGQDVICPDTEVIQEKTGSMSAAAMVLLVVGGLMLIISLVVLSVAIFLFIRKNRQPSLASLNRQSNSDVPSKDLSSARNAEAYQRYASGPPPAIPRDNQGFDGYTKYKAGDQDVHLEPKKP